jgi:NAD(P)-dependent dehydrogenase (short-subunit alcohol dehydrogenase family)
MNKTVLITGSSSGIGRATAKLFHDKGWNVVATMRTPEKEKEMTEGERRLLLPLDVTRPETMRAAIERSAERFGGIDVLVNNAGYALSGPFEHSRPEQVAKQFATNVFGLMDLAREILPHFRSRKGGTLINVASMGGRLTVPLYSVYHSSKWAVEGFSESLQYELMPLGICVKIIEPGAIKTDFYDRSAAPIEVPSGSPYADYVKRAMANMNKAGATGAAPERVAKAIFAAATDGSGKLRYTVGQDAKSLLMLRRFISDRWFMKIVSGAITR